MKPPVVAVALLLAVLPPLLFLLAFGHGEDLAFLLPPAAIGLAVFGLLAALLGNHTPPWGRPRPVDATPMRNLLAFHAGYWAFFPAVLAGAWVLTRFDFPFPGPRYLGAALAGVCLLAIPTVGAVVVAGLVQRGGRGRGSTADP